MVFNVTYEAFVYDDLWLAMPLIKYRAHLYVDNHKLTASELLLDEYCLDTYGYNLKTICHKLITGMTIASTGSKKIICLLRDHELDKIATFICYGNNKLRGSRILFNAWK